MRKPRSCKASDKIAARIEGRKKIANRRRGFPVKKGTKKGIGVPLNSTESGGKHEEIEEERKRVYL